jgi:phosphoglycolate phosphatase-like HAD superfamily hydrolase
VSCLFTFLISATNIYAPHALARCAIPIPQAGYVTSNDVTRGKPHPDPYLAGAKKCGTSPSNCSCTFYFNLPHADTVLHLGLVIEDAPSGLKAGHAAGAQTLAVCTSHTRQAIFDSGAKPDYIAKDLSRLVTFLLSSNTISSFGLTNRVSVRHLEGKFEVIIDETAEGGEDL